MITCKLDWLSFTFKSQETGFVKDEFERFLKAFPEIADRDYEFLMLREGGSTAFYDHVLMFNEQIRISYRVEALAGKQKDTNMGVNVSIPAHGLEFFFDLMGYKMDCAWRALADLKRRGCQFSRLDFAYDDYSKTFSPSQYNRWMSNSQIVTNFQKFRYIGDGNGQSGCFYLGRRSAGRILRIYDKTSESKGKIDAIRYEFEMHGELTEKFVDYIIGHEMYPDFNDVLNEWIKKVVTPPECDDPAQDKTRRQRNTLPEWEEFVKLGINEENHVPFPETNVTKAKDTTDALIKKWNWICNQVAPTLHEFSVLLGFDTVAKALDKRGFSMSHEILQTLYYTDPKKYSFIKDDLGTMEYGRDYKNFW